VDNIRSSHPEALQWAKTMMEEHASDEEKKKMFRAAMNKQVKLITGY